MEKRKLEEASRKEEEGMGKKVRGGEGRGGKRELQWGASDE